MDSPQHHRNRILDTDFTGGAFPPPQGLPSATVFARIQWENAREPIDLRWFSLRAFPLNPGKDGAALCAGPCGGRKAPLADSP